MTVHPPSMSEEVFKLQSKEKRVRVLHDAPLSTPNRVVPIGSKTVQCYTNYISNQVAEGCVEVIQLSARGYRWLQKSRQIAEELVESKTLNVFIVDVFETLLDDKPLVIAIITLAIPSLLPETNPKVWKDFCVKRRILIDKNTSVSY